jgi:acyl-coenzyme A thioesterase PaaI-like protein
MRSFQDDYPETYQHCYGCGVQNSEGLQIRSFWDGAESVALFEPKPYHLAFPGFVYGGLIASLIDCHCVATAAAAAYRQAGREPGTQPQYRYVTASLKIDFHRPTPLGPVLEVRAKAAELTGRKALLTAVLLVNSEVTVTAEVVAVQIPEGLGET